MHRFGRFGLIYLIAIGLVAILAPLVAPEDPNAQNLMQRLQSPNRIYLLGTDEFGRDVLSRLIFGARISLVASGIVVGVSAILGIPFGMAAGYGGDAIDWLLGRVNDGLMSIPALILALTIVAALGPGLFSAMGAVGIVFAPRLFRVARAVTADTRRETFIEASHAIGCGSARVLWQHIVPNILTVLVIQVSVVAGIGVNAEAALSFLGLGVSPPTASWGAMLSSALTYMSNAPHLAWPPGIMIALTVLSFTAIGEGLRHALGVRESPRFLGV